MKLSCVRLSVPSGRRTPLRQLGLLLWARRFNRWRAGGQHQPQRGGLRRRALSADACRKLNTDLIVSIT